MGEVYRAHDSQLNRDVAIKVLPAAAVGDSDQLARFRREAQALASLNHPNIATIHGLEETPGGQALVLELVAGSTLSDRLAHGPLPIVQAMQVARQIATALQTAHEQGIVHRDLKPGNIMLRPDGMVKVLDFGVAKLSEPKTAQSDPVTVTTSQTKQGWLVGTPPYMAPEQIAGAAVDKSADIWSFGAVLYEMLTGQRAFPGREVSEVLPQVLNDEPRWALLPPDTPSSLRRLLQRCLTKDRRSRLHDLGDALLEIDDLLTTPQGAVAAMPPPSSPVSRRAGMGTLVVLVLVAAALGAFAVRFISRDPSASPAAATSSSLPLVIMMDSAYPARVYDPETLAAGGTNADAISDLLADLPIRRQKETIGPQWHRDEEIRQFQPDLILIHYSGFLQEAPLSEPRTRLKVLVQFLAETPTQILIYGRNTEANMNSQVSTLLGDLYLKHPGLQQRIRAFGLLDYGPPRWVNTVTGTQLKLVVKEMLHLP
jgi:hypothetical protein